MGGYRYDEDLFAPDPSRPRKAPLSPAPKLAIAVLVLGLVYAVVEVSILKRTSRALGQLQHAQTQISRAQSQLGGTGVSSPSFQQIQQALTTTTP